MLQEKKSSIAKASRRDIATLMEKGRMETARVKVENIINEDIYVELLELLELYCELLIARFGLLDISSKDPDPGIREGVCAVIYAAPRTELKELHVLREMLMHKYGREFSLAVMENREGCVTERIVRRLSVETPSASLVDGYLKEICRAYGIMIPGDESGEAGPAAKEEKEEESPGQGVTDEIEIDGGIGSAEDRKEDKFDELTRRFEALKKNR